MLKTGTTSQLPPIFWKALGQFQELGIQIQAVIMCFTRSSGGKSSGRTTAIGALILVKGENQWRRVLEKSMELINVTATRTTRAASRARTITTFS
jgi:hypothetical protein